MTEEGYERMSAPWRRHPQALRALLAANKLLTAVGYVAYPALLAMLALVAADAAAPDTRAAALGALVRCVAVPAVSFVAVSLLRSCVNAPRPYEALAINPLIKKDTCGKSFPSRHAFSMFMIACTWVSCVPDLACALPVGVALLVAGVLMACVRVIGGVHYVRDVVAGALIAVAITCVSCAFL